MVPGLRVETCVPELCAIPAGSFMMGDDAGRFDERPAHRVRVRAFALGRFPVMNREFAAYLAATGAAEPRFWRDARFSESRQPVVGVSWFEGVAYCRWLSDLTGRGFRLPTEAEREWAALGARDRARYP